MDNQRRQSWTDRHGIRKLVSSGPRFPIEIVKSLEMHHVARSTVYQQIKRGLETHGIKELPDGRVASMDYSPTQEAVQAAILRIIDKQSLGGFFTDASLPGYVIELVAIRMGGRPSEADFYAVMKRLRTLAEDVGGDKELFFQRLGWEASGPGGPHQPPESIT